MISAEGGLVLAATVEWRDAGWELGMWGVLGFVQAEGLAQIIYFVEIKDVHVVFHKSLELGS